MAVNYGLGGFQNGSAYGYFASNASDTRTFANKDEYEKIKNVFTEGSYLNTIVRENFNFDKYY